MKKTKRLWLYLFVVTFVVEIVLVVLWLELASLPMTVPVGVMARLALIFPVVPFFCLQMHLCRCGKGKWVRCAPLLVIGIAVLLCGMAFLISDGWDSLGWLIMLLMCIAPAVGCGLGFLAHWIVQKRN